MANTSDPVSGPDERLISSELDDRTESPVAFTLAPGSGGTTRSRSRRDTGSKRSSSEKELLGLAPGGASSGGSTDRGGGDRGPAISPAADGGDDCHGEEEWEEGSPGGSRPSSSIGS